MKTFMIEIYARISAEFASDELNTIFNKNFKIFITILKLKLNVAAPLFIGDHETQGLRVTSGSHFKILF